MIKFERKNFSILSDVKTGAGVGAAVGAVGSGIYFQLKGKNKKSTGEEGGSEKIITFKKKNIDKSLFTTISTLGAMAVGAALGAIIGGIKEVGNKINRKITVDARTMKSVVDNLVKENYKEGKDFTRDPKKATELKTKVCIAITKNSGDLKVLVNMVSDNNLKNTMDTIIKGLSKSIKVTQTSASDKFNDVTLSVISDISTDAYMISDIAKSFIEAGYPVYLVEVG